jgi:hypothetical protein
VVVDDRLVVVEGRVVVAAGGRSVVVGAATPVPDSALRRVLSLPNTTVTEPVWLPAAVGVKTTSIVQDAPVPTGPGLQVPPAMPNGAVAVTLSITTETSVAKVSVCGPPVCPTATIPKVTLDGVSVWTGWP